VATVLFSLQQSAAVLAGCIIGSLSPRGDAGATTDTGKQQRHGTSVAHHICLHRHDFPLSQLTLHLSYCLTTGLDNHHLAALMQLQEQDAYGEVVSQEVVAELVMSDDTFVLLDSLLSPSLRDPTGDAACLTRLGDYVM